MKSFSLTKRRKLEQSYRQSRPDSLPLVGRVREGSHPQSRPAENNYATACRIACLLAVLSLLLLPSPATAQASLFFTPEETQAIASLAQTEPRKSEQSASPGYGDISLDAILYYGPHDWTIWLQGEPWTPATNRPGLRILKVSPDRVTLKRTTGEPPTPSFKITLKPHQLWKAGTEEISENADAEEETEHTPYR